jgi:hydrogenase maturation protein HypF
MDLRLPFLMSKDPMELDVIRQQIKRKLNCPLTSSCGRLFDAASALAGVRDEVQYDAQAAIELEMLGYSSPSEKGEYPFSVSLQEGVRLVRLAGIFQGLIADTLDKTSPAKISARFHNTIARIICSLCTDIAKETGLTDVVLSGGVFQNRLLVRKASHLLTDAGMTVLTHHQVPCNDGGISLGQAVVGAMAGGSSGEARS